MIEMPEAMTIARQMDETLTGKTFRHFERGPLVHKFLWLNKSAEEYDAFLVGKQVTGLVVMVALSFCMWEKHICCVLPS